MILPWLSIAIAFDGQGRGVINLLLGWTPLEASQTKNRYKPAPTLRSMRARGIFFFGIGMQEYRKVGANCLITLGPTFA